MLQIRFQSPKMANDVGLIRTKNKFDFSKSIQRINCTFNQIDDDVSLIASKFIFLRIIL